MNRETESHFSNVPGIDISRSKFDRSFTHKTTFDNGELIPIYVDTTIMPGDTVKMRMSEIVRMATPITPVMDNCNLDLYFFFVPYRLIWNHFKEFMGENKTAPWTQQTEYTIPQIRNGKSTPPDGKYLFLPKSLGDYMGYPTNINEQYEASALPFRAYCLIWNEFFRDENLENPVNIPLDETTTIVLSYENPSYNEVSHCARGGGKPLKVCKYHDYFTSALPGAQKGPTVTIPLGQDAPIVYRAADFGTSNPSAEGKEVLIEGKKSSTSGVNSFIDGGYFNGTGYSSLSQTTGTEYFQKIAVDLSSALGATVNQLRQAFAIQKFYERQARGGTRYIEMVKAHFNVTNPDYRVQRPEYLGGKRIPINMNQVIQSNDANSSSSTPLGTTGAYSVTSDRDDMFTHSFTEHGILMGLCCTRTVHTYQQGLNRQYSKKKITDFYFPEFANLGETAILNKEIYLQGTDEDEEAFGYQEAWASERYFPDIVTGEFRSNFAQSLDIWHYADNYNTLPSLGDTWIKEGSENLGRTLAVQNHSQFIADFYFGAVYTRPMPLYSIPGLIDHH